MPVYSAEKRFVLRVRRTVFFDFVGHVGRAVVNLFTVLRKHVYRAGIDLYFTAVFRVVGYLIIFGYGVSVCVGYFQRERVVLFAVVNVGYRRILLIFVRKRLLVIRRASRNYRKLKIAVLLTVVYEIGLA